MNKSKSKYFNTAAKMDKALISLLKKKSFEYITVSEICKEANVNRSTFYLHYDNTGDLLAEATDLLMNDFLSYFPADLKDIASKLSECELAELNFTTEKYLHPYLSYIKDNKTIFSTAISHANTFNFEGVYQKLFKHIFDVILNRFNYPAGDRKYVMMFYLNGINAIVTEWLKNGCDKTIEEVTTVIRSCIFGLDKGTDFHS